MKVYAVKWISEESNTKYYEKVLSGYCGKMSYRYMSTTEDFQRFYADVFNRPDNEAVNMLLVRKYAENYMDKIQKHIARFKNNKQVIMTTEESKFISTVTFEIVEIDLP